MRVRTICLGFFTLLAACSAVGNGPGPGSAGFDARKNL